MLTGRRFRLERPTLALGTENGKSRAVTVPMGAVIKIVAEPSNGNGMVDVNWEDRIVEMFAVDVEVRGTEVIDQSTTA